MLERRFLFRTLQMAMFLLAAGCRLTENSNSIPPHKPDLAVVPVHAQGEANALAEPNDVAIWLHPTDASRSVVLAASVGAPLQMQSLDGRRIGEAAGEFDYVDVSYGFRLRDQAVPLIIGHERNSGNLAVLIIDPETLKAASVSAFPLAIEGEVAGLCSYSSAATGRLYAFVVMAEGMVQQWELYERNRKVDGNVVRTIPIGAGAGYCAVDAKQGNVYITEESVGVWKLAAEPESDAERELVDVTGARGHFTGEIKGIAIHQAGESPSYLLAADVAAGRVNVYSTSDSQFLGSFTVEPSSPSTSPFAGDQGRAEQGGQLQETEGLAATSLSLGNALPGGIVVIADQDSGYRIIAWKEVAAALGLQNTKGLDPRLVRRSNVATVMPTVETEPVDDYGDAADDPAIWVHPTDPAKSVIIAAQKKQGLVVYDLAGKTLQVVADGRMNNVDLRQGFVLGSSTVAIVAASNRTNKTLALYKMDPASRQLRSVTASPIPTGFRDPYGLCMYRSAKTGTTYVFMNDSSSGAYKQWALSVEGSHVAAHVVREFSVGTQAEGCAADDATGALYIAEEDVGLWRYEAEPDGAHRRLPLDTTKDGHLKADVEGVSIYYGQGAEGYVIVSNQGSDNYAVYRREGNNEFIGHFAIVADTNRGIDGASETDGIDVISTPLGPAFSHGVFVAQDGRNITPSERQNFKLVPWERIASALSLQSLAADAVRTRRAVQAVTTPQ
jgi:3-phytase